MLASAEDFFCRGHRFRGADELFITNVIDLGEGRPLPQEPLAVRLLFGSKWVDEDGDEIDRDDEETKLTIVVDSAPFQDEFTDGCGVFMTTMTRKQFGAGREYLFDLPQFSVKTARGRFFRMRFLLSPHATVTLSAKLEPGSPKMPGMARS